MKCLFISFINFINKFLIFSDGMLLIHLPNGPTAHFKMSSVKFCKDIKVNNCQSDSLIQT